jgi:diguanylate cyclase (GGDEF)-like protein
MADPAYSDDAPSNEAADGDAETDFTLFDEEDRILQSSARLLRDLTNATGHVRDLQRAYKRAVREQKRMVRLSDRMQSELLEVKQQLEEEVRARAELAERFRNMAITDSLTGCFSRGHFLNLFDHELARFERSKRPISVVLLDVDHFKRINDTHGHGGGDQALIQLVEVLKRTVRSSDTVGRLGGEEFAVLGPETNAEAAGILAEWIRAAIEAAPVEFEGKTFTLTASLGTSTLTGTSDLSRGETITRMLALADEALYEAKGSGRNRVCTSNRST